MGQTLDSVVAAAKNTVLAISITSLLACAVTYARRDYAQYPVHRKEIAMFNMQNIASDFCGTRRRATYPYCVDMVIDNTALSFTTKRCNQWGRSYGSLSCDNVVDTRRTIYLNSVRQITQIDEQPDPIIIFPVITLRVCDEVSTCVNIPGFRNRQQALDFAEAMSVYLQ